MKFGSSVSILALLAVLVGCGSNSKVTEEQKAKFKELVKSTTTVVSSAKAAKNGTSALAVPGDTTSLESRISSKLNDGSCQFESPSAENMSSGSLSSINLKVKGDRCPISMEMTMSGSATAVNIRLAFEIKDAELAELSDVTKMELAGTINVSGQSGRGSIDGFIQSKKYGRVGLQLNVSGSESSAKIEIVYTFPDFKISLGVEQSANDPKYFINGNEVTADEFKTFVEGGSILPGASSPGLSGTAGPSNPTTPPTNNGGSSEFSYNLTENSCSTEQQSYASQAAMCEGLQSDSRNHGCAENLRRLYFTSHGCPGTFTPAP